MPEASADCQGQSYAVRKRISDTDNTNNLLLDLQIISLRVKLHPKGGVRACHFCAFMSTADRAGL